MRASYDVLVRISRRRKSGALMNAPNSALTELPVSSERGTPMSDSAETVIHVDEDVDEVAVSAEEVDQKIEEIEEEIEEEIREEIREVANVVGESVEEEVDAERAGFDRDSDTSTSIKAGSVGNHSRGSSTRKVDIKSLERLQERHKFWLIVLLVLGWWLVSAYIFHLTEPTWSYSDACYFAFVTLATIGFGDFIPSNPWSWEFWNIFVMSGIAIFAFFISTVVETYGRHFVASAALVERNIRSRAERAELERAKKRTGGRRREKKAEKGTV
ncbi:hypothetical protein BC829DRAFT_233461 [Chytridium lagenaria]|nr:hypothetical protein BC829DRAFT_233461 [Chytridium lagenaria]